MTVFRSHLESFFKGACNTREREAQDGRRPDLDELSAAIVVSTCGHSVPLSAGRMSAQFIRRAECNARFHPIDTH